LAQETRCERRERRKPERRSFRRQEAQAGPRGPRHGGQPNWKIGRRPSRDHEPKDEEERRSHGRSPGEAKGGAPRRGAQRANPTRETDVKRRRTCECALTCDTDIWPDPSLDRLGIRNLNPRAATGVRATMFCPTAEASARAGRLQKPQRQIETRGGAINEGSRLGNFQFGRI